MHAPAGERLGERALGRLVPEELRRLARMREAFEAVGLGPRLDLGGGGRAGHQRASASSRVSTARQTASADGRLFGGGVDEHAAIGLGSGDRRERLAQLPVIGQVALLVGVGAASLASPR